MPLHPAKQATTLGRFRAAQDKQWPRIAHEIAIGRKKTHWMWFVFPQLRVFAKSETAHHYGIADRAEALAYLEDDVLRVRLATATMGVLKQGKLMFTDVDTRKLWRCMTLFGELVPDRTLIDAVLTKHFGGHKHQPTLDVLSGKPVKVVNQWTPTAMGRVEWKKGADVGRHWEKQIAKARQTVLAVGQRMPRPDNEPMDSTEIESFIKGFGLSAAATRAIVQAWIADQSRANQQGWDAAEENHYWSA